MNVPRSKVFNAVYNLMSSYIKSNYQKYPNVPQFVTFSKNYKPYEKTFSDAQPSFYLALGPESPDQDGTQGVTRWEMVFYAIVFMQIDPKQTNPTPAEVILSTIDMLDDSLFNNGRAQTLASQNNGQPLVSNCWFDKRAGKVEIRQPILLPQAAIVAPITSFAFTQLNGMRT